MLPEVGTQDRNWAIYAHAAGLLILTSIPLGNVLASILIWLKVRNDAAMPFARAHAAAALNFQLTWTIFTLAFVALLFVLALNGGRMVLLPAIAVAFIALAFLNVLLSIVGCARASDVKGYHYPLSIRFVR